MKVAFIAEPRYARQEMTRGLIAALRQRGVAVDCIASHDCHFDPEVGVGCDASGDSFHLDRYDLLLSRSRNALGLAMLSYAEASGIPTVNSSAAIRRARDKAEVALALGPAGVPTAPTILADDAQALAMLPDHWFPLILKATHGDNSQGLRVIRQPEELTDLRWGDHLALAQHYVPNDGFDLKLYVSGDHVMAMRSPSPLNGDASVARCPVEPDVAMRELALRCGEVLGLDIYGVDAISTDGGPVVIEVNEFPNFTGVPGAVDVIARHVTDRYERSSIRRISAARFRLPGAHGLSRFGQSQATALGG